MTNSVDGFSFLEFSSSLPADQRPLLEHLFFFNERQHLLLPHIQETVAKTGVPEIAELDGRIWLRTSAGDTQCLFILDTRVDPPHPVGVALYARPSPDTLWVSHMAIDANYSSDSGDGPGVGLALIERIRALARHIRGVVRLQLPYHRSRFLRVARTPNPKAP